MARRLPGGGRIDRSRPLDFGFDGLACKGFAGDTVASALLASGIRVVGRSFKYHRPRGIWGHWVEEPNALLDLVRAEGPEPNARATTSFLREGMLLARSVNTVPSAATDRKAWIDSFSRFIPAAFYYKTFMWPDWHLFEPRIRAMAGLGRIDPIWQALRSSAQRNVSCDVLVVGAGPAGLETARLAASAARSVVLVDDRPELGGSLLFRDGLPDGNDAASWIASSASAIEAAGGKILTSTTAYGVFDHNLVAAAQRHADGRPDTLWRIRAGHVVLAAGAIERPLVFADNDRPGVMSAEAALAYLRQYAVLVGESVVVATNNDVAYQTAMALRDAGASVTVADVRSEAEPMAAAAANGIAVRRGVRVVRAEGGKEVEGVRLSDGSRVGADVLLVSGGYTPTVHLFCQSKGRLAWDDGRLALLPEGPVAGMTVVGAANGAFELASALAQARAVIPALDGSPASPPSRGAFAIAPAWPDTDAKGRAWIDYQNDVTLKDIAIAARESFTSVEHLKRYTTLGMATDQGKTSNVNGIAAMAARTGRSIHEVGVTIYRPPFTPVSFLALAGTRRGEMMSPVRRLACESIHREFGATLDEYGGWLRPAFYGQNADAATVIEREVRTARDAVAIFDGSSLGKIEVMGPDAAAFMDFNYYNTMSTLKPGRIRYGFMLQETGFVYDDGVLARLSPERFVVSCSTSHVAGVHARLEEWRQDSFDPRRLFVHNATVQWATFAVTGPRSRELVGELGLGVDLSNAALPHMAVVEGAFAGRPARVARVSFTGDRSYEVSVPARLGDHLLRQLIRLGKSRGATLLGVESLMRLRAEKGYVIVGKDTDGATMPHDLGLVGPREKRTDQFVGRRSLFTEAACMPDRRQLVGLESVGGGLLPVGAHGVEVTSGRARSTGFVTSSYDSPTLGRPIALGLIERGSSRMGETITLQHLGGRLQARISPTCAFDPKGERIDA